MGVNRQCILTLSRATDCEYEQALRVNSTSLAGPELACVRYL